MADDQRPESLDDDLAQQSAPGSVDPTGEQLSDDLVVDADAYEILDSDAEELELADEELDSTPFEADPEDVVIDDPDQLAAAEQVAAKARSSRPVKRSKQSAVEAPADSEVPVIDEETESVDAAQASTAAAVAARRPVRRTEPAVAEAARRPVRRKPTDKSELGQATPSRRQSEVAVTQPRTTPAAFVEQSVGELRKVIWPTADQLRQYFVVVLVFVLFIIAYVSLLDLGFGWVLLRLFGK